MENFETYRLDQTGQQTQEILDQVSTNTADIAQLRALYEALTQSEPVIIQPSDTWPVTDPHENVIYRVIDRVNTPPQSYSDYMWNGTAMVLMATCNNSIDNEPTPGSNNLVKSGGVAASIIFDISAYHATGSTLATYANLAAALGTDGANVPSAVRKGGMSVKFVQSSDNKYVQARLMAQNFTTDVTQWQGVDSEPVAGSDNLVKSGGLFDKLNPLEKKVIPALSTPYNLLDLGVTNGTRTIVPVSSGTFYMMQFASSLYGVNVLNSAKGYLGTLGQYATASWGNTCTLPENAAYIIFDTSSSYPNGYFGKEEDYQKWVGGIKVKTLNTLEIPQIKEYVDPEIDKINVTGDNFNLIDNAIIVQDGDYKKRLFYINGNTEYYISQLASGMTGWVYLLDASNTFIAYIDTYTDNWNTVFTSPSNAARMVIQADINDEYADTMYVGAQNNYEKWQSGFKKPLLSSIYTDQSNKDEFISIGIGTPYPMLKDGFAYANENNLGVIITPGIYNLVNENVEGNGLVAPKHIIGYGAVIQANLSSLNNEFSPININSANKETVIEGITVVCNNCRYALHDEMYNRAGFYHNIYKNCKFISNGVSSQEWVAPRAVGGGLGNSGYIEFENCEFESNVNYGDLDYHSNGSGTQTGNCEVHISNCIFKHAVQCTPIGNSTSFMNKVYVSGCLFGSSLPTSHEDVNIKMIAWGNVLNN